MAIATAPSIGDWRSAVDHPISYVEDVLGAEPDPWQFDVLNDLADPSVHRIAVKSCHGPGKTALAAWSILWWLPRYMFSKVPATAPTEHQLRDNLWPECHKWMRLSPWGLDHLLLWTKERISAIGPKGPEPEWYAAARVSRVSRSGTSDKGEAYGLQGFHAKQLLFVIDEASGVPDAVYVAIEGALATGMAKILAIGNPNTPSGWFWRAFHREQAEWSLHTVSYKDSPRVSDEWAESMIRRYGLQHPWVRVRVFGEFPAQAEKGLVGLFAWEQASHPSHHERLAVVGGRRVLGVDVARYGTNNSIIAYATGPVCHKIESHSGVNNAELAALIRRAIPEHEPHMIVIDADGPGGGVVDILRADKIPNVIEWHEGGSTTEPDNYINIRAELAWKFKLAIEAVPDPEIAVPHDDNAEAQAVNITYDILPTGKIQIESKTKLAERMGSPDEFDAIRYALAPYLIGPTSGDGAVVIDTKSMAIPDGILYG